MDNYYTILNVNSNATLSEINDNYNKIITNFKTQPFLTENDKANIKIIKKAYFVLSNEDYRKIYDTNRIVKQNISNQVSQNNVNQVLPQPNVINKKAIHNNSVISDRIFSMSNNSMKLYNVDHSEILRPKNVGLSSDIIPTFDTPLDYHKNKLENPLEFDPNSDNSVMPFDA